MGFQHAFNLLQAQELALQAQELALQIKSCIPQHIAELQTAVDLRNPSNKCDECMKFCPSMEASSVGTLVQSLGV